MKTETKETMKEKKFRFRKQMRELRRQILRKEREKGGKNE